MAQPVAGAAQQGVTVRTEAEGRGDQQRGGPDAAPAPAERGIDADDIGRARRGLEEQRATVDAIEETKAEAAQFEHRGDRHRAAALVEQGAPDGPAAGGLALAIGEALRQMRGGAGGDEAVPAGLVGHQLDTDRPPDVFGSDRRNAADGAGDVIGHLPHSHACRQSSRRAGTW